MKARLEFEMPSCCRKCYLSRLTQEHDCACYAQNWATTSDIIVYDWNTRPDWCPLQEVDE